MIPRLSRVGWFWLVDLSGCLLLVGWLDLLMIGKQDHQSRDCWPFKDNDTQAQQEHHASTIMVLSNATSLIRLQSKWLQTS